MLAQRVFPTDWPALQVSGILPATMPHPNALVMVVYTDAGEAVACWMATAQQALSSFIWRTTGKLLLSSNTPTVAAGFGTSPSIQSSNGTATFRVNVGTGGSASSGTVGLTPTASNAWNCMIQAPPGEYTRVTGTGSTFVVVTNYGYASSSAQAWAAADVLTFWCSAY